MSLKKRGVFFQWHEWIDGIEYRESLKTTDRNEAKRRRQDRITEIKSGRAGKLSRQSFVPALDAYLERRKLEVEPKTYQIDKERSGPLKRFFADTSLLNITADRIADYQAWRKAGGKISNRTCNMEVGLLRGLLKKNRLWLRIAESVSMLPETSDVGRALEHDELKRLLAMAATNSVWMTAYCAAVLALNTTMRSIEIKNLQWNRVDMFEKALTVSRKTTKTDAGERVIPLNRDAVWALSKLWERAVTHGEVLPEHFVFAACENYGFEPTRPMRTWRTAWRTLTRKAGLKGLRFHDLRHSAITALAEGGHPDHVIMSIAGHVSPKMLAHYSHIRLQAKRSALDALETQVAPPLSTEATNTPAVVH